MSQNKFRALSLAAASAIAMLGLPAPANAQAQAVSFETSRMDFNIPAQSLASALTEFSRQSQIPVLVPNTIVRGRQSVAVSGEMTPSEALARMSAGSGLRIQQTQEGGLTLIQEQTTSPTRLGAADGAAPSEEEIIVTAQKREERLRDVPVPVTALRADTLLSNNQTQLSDYYTRVPGLNLTDAGIYGGSVISFRGITSGILNGGTTSVVIDDVPYGIASNPGGPTSVVPEIDPSDIARVEILRGPQGTLYGASSMGGLLKYVTIEPDLDELSGYVRGNVNGVANGDGSGYAASLGVNVPLSDSVAIRVSAFDRSDPGYINDPVHNLDGINAAEASGGRLSVLWRPSPAFSAQLGALVQDSDSDGNNYVGPTVGFGPIGDLEQVSAPGSGGYHKVLQVYTANLSAQLGAIDLDSVTAYTVNKANYFFDTSSVHRTVIFNNFGVIGGGVVSTGSTTRFTQELRANIPIGHNIDWLIGAFYAMRKIRASTAILL